jgi:hypothetical protein
VPSKVKVNRLHFDDKLGSEVPSKTENKLAVMPKMPPVKESLRNLLACMAEMKDSLLDKLHAFDSQTFTQVLTNCSLLTNF